MVVSPKVTSSPGGVPGAGGWPQMVGALPTKSDRAKFRFQLNQHTHGHLDGVCKSKPLPPKTLYFPTSCTQSRSHFLNANKGSRILGGQVHPANLSSQSTHCSRHDLDCYFQAHATSPILWVVPLTSMYSSMPSSRLPAPGAVLPPLAGRRTYCIHAVSSQRRPEARTFGTPSANLRFVEERTKPQAAATSEQKWYPDSASTHQRWSVGRYLG